MPAVRAERGAPFPPAVGPSGDARFLWLARVRLLTQHSQQHSQPTRRSLDHISPPQASSSQHLHLPQQRMTGSSAVQAASGLRRLACAGAVASTSSWSTTSHKPSSSSAASVSAPATLRVKRRRLSAPAELRDGSDKSVGAVASSATSSSGNTLPRSQKQLTELVNVPRQPYPAADSPRAATSALPSSSSARVGAPLALSTATQATLRLTQHSNTRLSVNWSIRTPSRPAAILTTSPLLPSQQPSHHSRHFSLFRSTPKASEASPQLLTNSTSTGLPPSTNLGPAESPTAKQEPPACPSPRMDELNTLLRHPALYNPLLKPRDPIVLLHGTSSSLDWL